MQKKKDYDRWISEYQHGVDGCNAYISAVEEAISHLPQVKENREKWQLQTDALGFARDESIPLRDAPVASGASIAFMVGDELCRAATSFAGISGSTSAASSTSVDSAMKSISEYDNPEMGEQKLSLRTSLESRYMAILENQNERKNCRSALASIGLERCVALFDDMTKKFEMETTISYTAEHGLALEIRTFIEKLKGDLKSSLRWKRQPQDKDVWRSIAAKLPAPAHRDVFIEAGYDLDEIRRSLTRIGKANTRATTDEIRKIYWRTVSLSTAILELVKTIVE